ncbi:hypothetical protein AB3M89_02135 [Microbacterium sp. 179-I 3D2 NHS]|uniref:hypothetical protein n=1 Tax=Microbacterium sp. 179-I 3D2 NHS TaxID=3235178 RepID=UPI00399F1FA9
MSQQQHPLFSRRQVLAAGLVAGATLPLLGGSGALAAPAPRVGVTDLGPGVQTFTMMSSAMADGTIYMSTRNVEPMKVVGYHVATRSITSVTDVFGESTQAMAVEPTGRYLYGCVRINFGDNVTPVSRLLRIDLTASGRPMEPLVEIDGLIPFAMSIAPDGTVYFAGRQKAPRLYAYTPSTGALSEVVTPDPDAQYGRSLLATDDAVYFGLRGTNPSTGAAAARLYRVERATGAATSILPAELARTSEIRDMLLHEGTLVLVNGSVGALVDEADPSTYTVLRSPLNLGKLPVPLNGRYYFAGSRGVAEYDPVARTYRSISAPDADYGGIWGLFPSDGRLLVVSAYGLVFELDPATLASEAVDLVALGAPVGTQLAMSVATAAGSVYVGGTNAIGRHDLATGAVRNINASGEAKDIVALPDRVYTGQYSGWGVMGYSPGGPDALTLLAALPAAQNRPHDLLWDAERGRLYVGSGSDANVFGALSVFDPATGTIEYALEDPFGDGRQQVRCLARREGVLFLGGESTAGAQVMAWDIGTRSELWRVSLDPAPSAVCGLAIHGHTLYALGHSGSLTVIDLRGASGRVVRTTLHPALVPDWGSLTVRGGKVYGVSKAAFFRIDHRTHVPLVLVDGLGAEWYGVPRVAVAEDDSFYGIRQRNLVRITVQG